jgi:hypothetical protein
MKQIERIHFLIKTLRIKPLTLHELLVQVIEVLGACSLRQIQREINDIHFLLNPNEKITSFRKNYLKYYHIIIDEVTTGSNILINENLFKTNFYIQKKPKHTAYNIDTINTAINESKLIILSDIINDQTGDNSNFETKYIHLQPIKIIYHRDSYYIGGYNLQKKCIQIFGINQIEKVKLSSYCELSPDIVKLFNEELNNRFGVTKNIDSNTYNIVIEMSSVLAGFLKNNHWHHSQKFAKKNGNTIMYLNCGINRELMGWLFQWMVNIRVVEPEILKFYYDKTLNEIRNNNNSKTTLVYRNLFNDNAN